MLLLLLGAGMMVGLLAPARDGSAAALAAPEEPALSMPKGASSDAAPAAGVAGESTPLDAPGCGPNWNVVSSPNVGTHGSFLHAVAALSSSDVWAVGFYNNGSANQTLAEHWDGTAWSVISSPNVGTHDNYLLGVTALSSSDVRAVGHYNNGTVDQTLIEHWDGTSWSVISSPNVGPNGNYLNAIAVSSSDVWAVGYYFDGAAYRTLIERRSGLAWVVVPSPNMGTHDNHLSGVAVVASSDVWAVGDYSNGTKYQTLVEHWNGASWSIMPSSNLGTSDNFLSGVAAVSGSDVWAVGYYFSGTVGQTLVERWDGTAWSVVSSPNVGTHDNTLSGVAAISSSDVWAVGDYGNGTTGQTLVERWDGSTWSVVSSPDVGTHGNEILGVMTVGSSDVWTVGDYFNGTVAQTLVESYNPCPPTPTPTACPIEFTDVPNPSTFYAYIRCLACRGIINGYSDGTFKPNNQVTRGELSKIVSNAAGFSNNQTTQMFQDVAVGSTFFQYIGRLASRGYIGGYPCGGSGEPCMPPANLPYFRPNNNATRGQISKIVSNAAGFLDPPSGQQVQDVPIASTYYTYTYRLVSRNVMAGYPCGGVGEPCVPPGNLPYFRPNNNATRGQTSKIVGNTFFPDCQTP
jgi:hypothetical protein